jgi:quercetin dioxygenase-like cupin family protein
MVSHACHGIVVGAGVDRYDPPFTADAGVWHTSFICRFAVPCYMQYEYVHEDDVPRVDLSENDDMPPDHDIRSIDEALGLENVRANVWYIEPGDEIGYHAHSEQEEVFYVLEGTFSLKLGRSGETETVEAKPGTWWAAEPMVGHGHRNGGDETGIVLAFGAPAVDDSGLNPHQLDE